MRIRALILAASMCFGCNVFLSLDGVEIDDGTGTTTTGTTGTTGTTTGPTVIDCGTSCTCEADCARSCDTSCAAKCETGACDIRLGQGGDVTCEAGSDCYVDCERGTCAVNCEAGASCVLRCGPNASSCDFSSCSGVRATCPGMRETCDASC